MDEQKLNRCAVIGNPISHSLSPYIHQHFAEQFGFKLSYERMLVEQGEFEKTVKTFFSSGGLGLNITTPFKSDASAIADSCSAQAGNNKSANTLYLDSASGLLVGETTDSQGWLNDINRLKINLKDSKVLVIGAGGAARVLVNQLSSEALSSLHVCNRTQSKAQALATNQISYSGLLDIPEQDWDLIINTLSVGWQGGYPEFNARISATTLAYDLNYGDGARAFKDWFDKEGGVSSNFHNGWGMLVEQAALSFSLWWGKQPDTQQLVEQGPPS